MTKISKNGVVRDMTVEEETEHDEFVISSKNATDSYKAIQDTHDANKASGKQKLKDLGLNDAEIASLIGTAFRG